MIQKWYEKAEYQIFLTSQERDSYLPGSVYTKLIQAPSSGEEMYILDFGTGLGYASISMATAYQKFSNIHIYACEHQELLLDQLWNTLTNKKLNRVTPFFLPAYSSINFPTWLPKMDQIVCSLSLSASESPEEVLQTIHKIGTRSSTLHILDWYVENMPEKIRKLIPEESILDPEMIKTYLKRHSYTIEKTYLSEKHFFIISAKVP